MQYQEFRFHRQWRRWLGWPTSITVMARLYSVGWEHCLGLQTLEYNILNTIVYIYMNMSPFLLGFFALITFIYIYISVFLLHFSHSLHSYFLIYYSFSSTHQVLKLELSASSSSWELNYKFQAFPAMALGIVSFILTVHFDYFRKNYDHAADLRCVVVFLMR